MVCELYFNEAVKALTCLKVISGFYFNTESDSVKSETGAWEFCISGILTIFMQAVLV